MKNRIAEIFIRELQIEGLTPESFDPEMHLVDELGIDSMDLATVAVFIQDEFQIKIDEDDYVRLLTLNDICEYIESKLEHVHPAPSPSPSMATDL